MYCVECLEYYIPVFDIRAPIEALNTLGHDFRTSYDDGVRKNMIGVVYS